MVYYTKEYLRTGHFVTEYNIFKGVYDMPGKFEHKTFAQINLNDPFFDSLKRDYPEFETNWFPKGVRENRPVLVFSDEHGLGAFVAMKIENEPIYLNEGNLPACPRLKISTLRLAERFRGQRLGEGALGLILWDWQHRKLDEIYVTVFPKHTDLITQITRFGFCFVGTNARGERVYLRSRKKIDFSDPYKAFPFLSPSFKKGGYLIVEDNFHDTLFPYSELKNTLQEKLDIDVANGVSKIYIGAQRQVHYQVGEPVFIYRKYSGVTGKRYKSCLTSYCIVTGVVIVKRDGRALISFNDFCSTVGNKSIFSTNELCEKFRCEKNLTVIQLLYGGYFGSGNNVNMDWLSNNGMWSSPGVYPTNVQLTRAQCAAIWNEGGLDAKDVVGG